MNISTKSYCANNTNEYTKTTPVQNSEKPQPIDVEQLKKELASAYGELHFDFRSFDTKEQLKQYAAKQSGQYNVIISDEILYKMTQDHTVRQNVEHLLSQIVKKHNKNKQMYGIQGQKVLSQGTVIDSDGKVSEWTVAVKEEKKFDQFYTSHKTEPNPADDSRDPDKILKEKTKLFKIAYKFSVTSAMTRIAQANSPQAVNGIIASSRGEIQKAKAFVEDKYEAQRIVKKIKNVIQKGQTKVVRLKKEEVLRRRRKMAEKKQKAALEKELAEKLRKKRMARKGQENCESIDFDEAIGGHTQNNARYRMAVEEYTAATASVAPSAMPFVSLDGSGPVAEVTITTSSASIDITT